MKASYVLALAFGTTLCCGQSVYSYTGHNLTVVSGAVPASDHITVSLTVPSTFPANASIPLLTPSAWSVSDGVTVLSSSDGHSTISAAQITTDGAGKITSWNIVAKSTGVQMQTCLILFQCDVDLTLNSAGTGSIQASPGTWTVALEPPPVMVPEPPSQVTAAAGPAKVTLTWTASAGASAYNVKRATASGGPYTTLASAVSALSYIDVGLTNGDTYYYVISALGPGGEGPNSAQVSAKPAASTLVISPATAANGTVGTAYSFIIDASGGVPPYSCSFLSGTLPPGLSFVTGQSTGLCSIAGTPTAAGAFSFAIQVTDRDSTVTQTYETVITLPIPSICSGCVLNAASFAKDANGHGTPVAPGSLVVIFTSPLAAQPSIFTSAPLNDLLGGVGVTFSSVSAPMVSVTPAGSLPYVSAQVPFEALPGGMSSATVPVTIVVNGVPSAPVQTPIVQSAPGIFTIPPTGQGNAILVFLNPSTGAPAIAAPVGASIGYPAVPIPRGTPAFFYVTGLGAMTPSVTDGSGTCPAANGICNANASPQVLIGGISAPVGFAGQAPGFPGVYQVNIMVPQNAPVGNNISLIVVSADGSVTSNTASIAIQ